MFDYKTYWFNDIGIGLDLCLDLGDLIMLKSLKIEIAF